jgi:hypothetical protein
MERKRILYVEDDEALHKPTTKAELIEAVEGAIGPPTTEP